MPPLHATIHPLLGQPSPGLKSFPAGHSDMMAAMGIRVEGRDDGA